jgi:hypothetical protein
MEFKLTDLEEQQSNVVYIPGPAIAANKLLELAGKNLNELIAGRIKVDEIPDVTNYGTSSYLKGSNLWMPLWLWARTDGEYIEYHKMMLLESAKVDLTRTKNIITTVVQGRDTAVDEFINNGDWQITISGEIGSQNQDYPHDQVINFEGYIKLNEPIKVIHDRLNKIGIDEIVILSVSLPQSPHMNTQPYTIQAKSTVALPLIVELKKDAEIV